MPPVVETVSGKLEGEGVGGVVRVTAFRGVPFARPVSGPLRFAAPQPPDSWPGVRAALRFGPAAPQPRGPMSTVPGFAVDETGDDCLTLNVWTPGPGGPARPVMVWVPGGGFTMGSGSQEMYDGAALAARGDVVVVTVNYRLGALGFLYPKGIRASGFDMAANAGLLDQVAALRWVRDNIAAFGGDPGQVTVFGESAGGMSVACLLAMPSARGLFHRAIAQSGADNVAAASEAEDVSRSFLSALGVAPSDAGRLAEVPIDDLLAAQESCSTQHFRERKGLAWRPAVDDDQMPRSPCDAEADGSASAVPLLIGTNQDEWRLFGLGDPRSFNLDEERLASRLEKIMGAEYVEVLDAYRTARPGASPSDLWFAIESDRVFRVPAVRLAEAHSRNQPRTYSYLFTWQSAASGLGACHGLEIPFVFGNLEKPGMPVFAGSGPEVVRLSEAMQDAWLAFVRSGDPSTDALGPWPSYDGDRRATMLFGATCEVAEGPADEERRAWEKLPAHRGS